MGGACGAPRLLGIYLISKMHTETIQKIQKAYIKTYEEDVKIYKDIENSQGQGFFFLQTPVTHHRWYFPIPVFRAQRAGEALWSVCSQGSEMTSEQIKVFPVFSKKEAPCPWEFSISVYIFTSSSYVFIFAFCIFCIVFVCIFDIR